MSAQSAIIIDGDVIDDKRYPDISIPAQASTTLRPQSIDYSPTDEDKGYPSIGVLSKTPPTTQTLHSLKDKDARSSTSTVSIGPAAVDHFESPMEAKNDDDRAIPIQVGAPFITSKYPSIGRGEDVQGREAGHGVDSDFSIPNGAPTITTEHSVDHGDRVVQRGDAPSTSFFQGSSNVEISGSNFYEVHGNATIIRVGDGQFTDVQRNLIYDYIANRTSMLPDINNNLKKHVLTQSIISLPRAKAVFDDYQNKKKSGSCFKGTREALLREVADWATSPSEPRMYILSGLAGIGKSTVAYTIASRAADLNLLGASFFFSRDEADRKNAEFFFSTIAYQLCIYNETFAKAIGDVLLTERGSASTTKNPQDQLRALILDPLRNILQSHTRPILVVVDALDECDEEDSFSVLAGLSQLVRDLPSFKIILTTRPQPFLDRFLSSQVGHKLFRLQDIEDRVIDGDIRLYLQHCLCLEEVQRRYPSRRWCASNEEIDSLVRAAGRLFIIASTAVRYIFNKSASNPAAQMQKLLHAFARYATPFKDLDHFYTVILRNVVPANCDNDDTVSRYQSVVGAIIFVQHPLPVSILAHLINIDVVEIHTVLDHLQSVISLDENDVPRVYHKSFPDYLTDQARCKDPQLQIDIRIGHTRIATHCFEVMDKHLKRNILGLGDWARFMRNEDALEEDGITDPEMTPEHTESSKSRVCFWDNGDAVDWQAKLTDPNWNQELEEKIPQQLRYSCVYWANHLKIANIGYADLMNGLERFVYKHILHWFEVLSLIGKLDLAHHAIGVVLKLVKSETSDLHQLLSDALRFIGKFYELIKQSALHTYYSALPFTPSDSLLYRRYNKEAGGSICSIEGGPEKWDALVANLSHGYSVDIIKFSLASALFASCSSLGELKIWDAATGTPISTIPGDKFAVANDFSQVLSSDYENLKTITFYNVNGSPSGTILTTSSTIEKLALSSESSRVAAALSDGTVWLWDSGNAKLMDCFDQCEKYGPQLKFSPTGSRLAYSSAYGISMRDGISGRFIANLRCGSHKFEFSGDGSRIASVSRAYGLTLWNSESGERIGAVTDVDRHFAISANGSLLSTADANQVTLWSENDNNLVQIKVLESRDTKSMTFSLDNILAIATSTSVKLYNVKAHSLTSTLPLGETPEALAFSPDCTRLAVGADDGNVKLWDIPGIDASGPLSKEKTPAVTALALSRDCSRLARGFEDGTVELWGTSPTMRRIRPPTLRSKMKTIFFPIFGQSRHTKWVGALGFDPDGRLFASGSGDQTVKLWNGEDGALRGTLKAPGWLKAVALSNSVLVATWYGSYQSYDGVTLWNLDTLRPIHTFKGSHNALVSIAENSTLIAVTLRHNHVALLDVVNCTTITTFDVPFDIRTMSFLPDNSQLVVQSGLGYFQSLNLVDKCIIKGSTLENLVQLPNTPLWQGAPVWHYRDIYNLYSDQYYFGALFSEHKNPVPVLWIPRELPVTARTQGSSMIALGCEDGRVILLRLPTSHVS